MPAPQPFRRAMLALAFFAGLAAHAQNPADIPTAAPAGVAPSTPEPTPPKPVSEKDKHEADNAYLQGARQISKRDYAGAEANFARATVLNPTEPTYPRALAYARESRVIELIHASAAAKQAGDPTKAKSLLDQAHALDPQNKMVAEHLSSGADAMSPAIDPLLFPAADIASTLSDGPHLKPIAGTHDFHERGDPQSVLRNIYAAFGIKVQFDPSVTGGQPVRFDLEHVTFDQATSLIHQMTKTFAAPVQSDLAIIAQDNQDNRDRLVPQLEETIYLRGQTSEQMQDLANLARNVYDIKNVTASATAGTILIRADEPTLKLINAEYADLLDGDSDVLLDVNLYEIDTTRTRNYGVTLPGNFSVFSIYTELENAVTANQTAINAFLKTIDTSQLTPLGLLEAEVGFLSGAGLLSTTQQSELTSLLTYGYIGNVGGVPLAGVNVASGATVAALLQSSDVRILDSIKLRASNAQKAQFRSGTRYPIVTSTYTTGASGLSSQLQSLASQYGISTQTTTIPQIQFEDLGLTLLATPKILRNGDVNLALDLKIESLGSATLNNIPELNNRQLTSTVTVPAGQTAFLVSEVNTNEIGSVSGFPGLNDLPGFTGTNQNGEKDRSELLISITPHVVRQGALRIASRRLSFPRVASSF